MLYIVFCLIAHYAYREFKGLAEDCAGGSINSFDGNILHYAIIDKREDDQLLFLAALDKKKKEWKEKKAKLGLLAASNAEEEAKGLLEEEKKEENKGEEDKKDNDEVWLSLSTSNFYLRNFVK